MVPQDRELYVSKVVKAHFSADFRDESDFVKVGWRHASWILSPARVHSQLSFPITLSPTAQAFYSDGEVRLYHMKARRLVEE